MAEMDPEVCIALSVTGLDLIALEAPSSRLFLCCYTSIVNWQVLRNVLCRLGLKY